MSNKIKDNINPQSKMALLEHKVNTINESLNHYTKLLYGVQDRTQKLSRDIEHMYRIVKKLHAEHKKIMQLNGVTTLLDVIDELEK